MFDPGAETQPSRSFGTNRMVRPNDRFDDRAAELETQHRAGTMVFDPA
jgi:hypothetical protein